MKNILKLLNDFEERNNISIAVTIYSDGSSKVEEFWNGEGIYEGQEIEDLEEFLTESKYQRCETNGRCFNPIKKIK